MFGKRKQRDQSRKQWQEPSVPGPASTASPAAGAEQPGEPKPSSSERARADAPRREPQADAPRPPSRPDASALLSRQANPPPRPEAMRPDQVRQPTAPHGASRQPSATANAIAGRNESEDSKRLTVGRGISLKGEIQACDKLIVEGSVEAELNNGGTLEVAESGLYKGSATIDVAEISGRFEGELTVRERLYLRSTARVQGTIRYRGLEIESGGRIGGTLVELSDEDVRQLKPSRAATGTAATTASTASATEPAATANGSVKGFGPA